MLKPTPVQHQASPPNATAMQGSSSTLPSQLPMMPELPTDYVRRSATCFRVSHDIDVFSRDLSIAVRRVTEAECTSPAALFLAAVQILLARYTDDELVTVGVLGQAADYVRPFTTQCSPDVRIRQLLQSATEHLRKTEPNYPAPAVSSWPVLFSYSAAAAPTQFICNLPLTFELHFAISISDNGCYAVTLAYDSDLFSSTTVSSMLSHLRALIEAAVSNPDALAWHIRMLSDTEWNKLVVEWNRNEAEESELCIHGLFENQALSTPTSIAVQFGEESLNYQQLNARANQLARYIRRQGIDCNTPVGIFLERSLELPVALLAVLKAGGVCVCLDPQYPSERLAYMISDARISVLLTERHLVERLDHVPGRVICLTEERQSIYREDITPAPNGSKPGSTAFLIYTSGSTGKPKGILLSHRGLVNHQRTAVKLYHLKDTDRILQFSSVAFDIALEEIFPTWLAGATVVFRTKDMPLDARGFIRWIAEQRITVLDLPTAYWHELIYQLSESPVSIPDTLRAVIIGGEKASASAFSKWLELVGTRVRCINTYGPSETSIIATACEMCADSPAAVPPVLPIGRPIANTQIYVLDRQLNPLPIGVPGEIYIGGVGVARGYLNRPELTATSFIPDPFTRRPGARLYKSGDRGRWLPNGVLEFAGRRDLQVKIRGYRVEPGEVEAVLLRHSSVRQAAVVANTSAAGITRLVAYVVPAQPGTDLTQQWRALLKASVPEYMVPSAFVILAALPLTPNGKIDRAALQRRDVSHCAVESGPNPVTDPIQAKLVEIWQSVLGIAPISITDNFWDLGGNSLLSARLIQNIERFFRVTLTFSVLIQAPTIAQLANIISSKENTHFSSCLVPLQPVGSKPPFFCVHGVGGTVMAFRALAMKMGQDHPFYGLQAQGLDEREPCLDRVEDMAKRYLKDIRMVQPTGPYYLGGFSFGGWVAWEMAQLLAANGEDVALLALLDSYPFRLQPITSSLMSILRIPTQQQLMYVLPKTVRKGIRRRVVWLKLPKGIKKVQRACYQAERRYTLRPYPGRVTLFRASESLHDSHNPHARWHELARSLDVRELSGHHGDIIIEPTVVQLAQELCACIDRECSAREESVLV